MTLKEAFKEWGKTAPKLWAGYRPEFTHVFLSEHGKDDVRQFTDFYVRKLMGKNKSTPRVQTRALAALVYTLEFAYKEGICQKPSFTPQSVMAAIASSNNPDKDAQETESTPQVLGEEEPAETSPQRSSNPKPRGSGRQQVKVSQLDPFTCKVVATFNSLTEASASTGANTGDISKAIKNNFCRHGFYWCLQGQEEEFRPAKKPRMRKKNTKTVREALTDSRMPATDKSSPGEKGGAQKDSCNPSSAIRADLSPFSDEELRDELERRGWYGTLYKRLGFENVKK